MPELVAPSWLTRLAPSRRKRAQMRVPARARLTVVPSRNARADTAAVAAIALDEPESAWNAVFSSVSASRVHVEVDSSVARLFAVPWQAPIVREAEWSGFAAARHQQLFGGDAHAWSIRLDDAIPPAARLAVALPNSVLTAVQTGFGSRLAGVRVDVVERLRRWIAAHPRYTGMVVALDHAGAWLIAYRSGRLQRVRRRRFAAGNVVSAAVAVSAVAPVVLSEWASVRQGADAVDSAAPAHLAIASGPAPKDFGTRLAQAVGARQDALE